MVNSLIHFYYYYNSASSNKKQFDYSIIKIKKNLFYLEQKPDCKTPVSRRLTPDIRRQFVLTLRGVAFLSMFGKDAMSVGSSQAALKYFACIFIKSFLRIN